MTDSPESTRLAVAIIQTGGKQYLVHEGEELSIERLAVQPEAKLDFTDLLHNAKVTAKVVAEMRAAKIHVRKFKSKVRYLRRRGHRQHQTRLLIEKIG